MRGRTILSLYHSGYSGRRPIAGYGRMRGMFEWRKALCRIGLHRWRRWRYSYISGSNVREWERRCERCGKRERRIEPI